MDFEHELYTAVSKRGYFVIAENELINNINLSAAEKLVFLSLCTYAGKARSCFPGQSGIAKNLGYSRQTVNRAIKSLEKKGGLLILHQVTESNRKTVNTYFLADVDQRTGEFIKESLDHLRELCKTPYVIKGK